MTGRDLILYILKNNLENEPVFKDGKFIGFLTVEEAAARFDIGVAAILAWIKLDLIPAFAINGVFYIPANIELNLHV